MIYNFIIYIFLFSTRLRLGETVADTTIFLIILYKSELSTGSIRNNSISEIWNGEKYSSLRNSHLNGQRTKCYPCDRCPNGS